MNLDFLPGKKTYILGFIMLAYGVLSAVAPEMFELVMMSPAEDAQRVTMEGLLVLTGRKAISRLET